MSNIFPKLFFGPLTNKISFSNKPNPAALNNNKGVVNGSSNGSSDSGVSIGGKACESCNGMLFNNYFVIIAVQNFPHLFF